ncbi:Autoinducer 2-degrading protein LsrG [Labrenzia sp. THAF82]|uniref:putative quinol monooxygenase n=1 Tax=Labrenzia sp. THAF82 TaxID=2587861 RepID=UPI00126963D7|nr:putative quinol monooxygenase [Labrenzia sp. THAF82]QFT33286.1 Autoinducer 2-degrading protein LsrG [Labrenzia sp. THAF82]
MFAVTVLFRIKDGQMNAFMPLMIANAQTSVKDEPGCRQFDVCTDPDLPGEVFLYEIYEDVAAFQFHLATDHFKDFDARVSDMIAEKSVKTFQKVDA